MGTQFHPENLRLPCLAILHCGSMNLVPQKVLIPGIQGRFSYHEPEADAVYFRQAAFAIHFGMRKS